MGEALAHHPFVVARLDYRKLNPAWLRSTQGDGYQTAGLSLVQCVPHLPHGSGCSFGLRRSLYEHLGPLSIEFPCVHDTEYSWRAQLAGYALHFEPRALIHYREKTAPAARFRQGRNWGHDFTRLSEAYGAPRPRLAVLRQTVAMARSLPRGAMAWLRSRRGVPAGRLALAEWIWDLGWATGKWLAWRERANDVRPPAPARMVPAATAPLPPVH
jgi:GT2 family glycosyltransferase